MDTSNSERCGAAEVTTPIKHLPKNYVGELIANSRLNRELVLEEGSPQCVEESGPENYST
jgi:hypothetical protein